MTDQQVRVEGGERLRAVARAFRDQADGKQLNKALRRDLRRAGGELVRAEKTAVRGLPSKGLTRRGAKGLRATAARATQLRIRTAGRSAGVAVWVNPKRMGPGRANLPGYMEGVAPFQRWRHPVFGDTDVWRWQRRTPWFYRTAFRQEARIRRGVEDVVDRMARDLENRI